MNNESFVELFEYLKQFGLISIGAVIPLVLSYFAMKKREKIILKINIQTKTAEILIESINKYIEHIEENQINISDIIIKYNKVIEDPENETNINMKTAIKNSFTDNFKEYIKYINTSLVLIKEIRRILIGREVILNKFIDYRKSLDDEINNFKTFNIETINYIESIINENIKKLEIIETRKINKLKEHEIILQQKEKNITIKIKEMHRLAQNVFLSKIFKYKVLDEDKIKNK